MKHAACLSLQIYVERNRLQFPFVLFSLGCYYWLRLNCSIIYQKLYLREPIIYWERTCTKMTLWNSFVWVKSISAPCSVSIDASTTSSGHTEDQTTNCFPWKSTPFLLQGLAKMLQIGGCWRLLRTRRLKTSKYVHVWWFCRPWQCCDALQPMNIDRYEHGETSNGILELKVLSYPLGGEWYNQWS